MTAALLERRRGARLARGRRRIPVLLAGALAAADPSAAAQEREAPPGGLALEPLLAAPSLAPYSPPAFSPDGRLLAYVVTDNARRREPHDTALHRSGVPWYGVAGEIQVADLSGGAPRGVSGAGTSAWSPSWSPDGRRLAFLAAEGAGGDGLGQARLHVWDRATGAVRRVSDADVREGHHGLHWTADGEGLLVAVFPRDLPPAAWAGAVTGRTLREPPATGVTARVYAFEPGADEGPPATDPVSLDLWRTDLARIDVADGSVRRIVEGERVFAWVLAPDRSRVAWAAFAGADPARPGQYLFDLFARDLPGGEARRMARDVPLDLLALDGSFAWSPDGGALAYRSGGPAAADEIHVVEPGAAGPRRVAAGPASAEVGGGGGTTRPVWGPAGRWVYFTRDGALWRASADGSGASELARSPGRALSLVAARQQRLWTTDGGRTGIVSTFDPATKREGFARVDLATGRVTPALEEDRRHGGYGTAPTLAPGGARLAYVSEAATDPPDLWIVDEALSGPRRITRVAPTLSAPEMGPARPLTWATADGDTLHGALVLPPGHRPGARHPLIVKVYGGSAVSDDLNRFGHAIAPVENVQIFATRGYAVLLADSRLEVGTPMADLARSVLPAVDRVVALGVADPERIGVTGHSYGGYSTLALVAQSPRFAAAVVRAGFGDLVGMYGQLSPDGSNYGLSWAETGQGRMGGSPWEVPERYVENSPFFRLDRVEAPVLLLHGGEDDAVPPFLADQLFTALRRLGKTVTYARYAGEGHWEGTWSRANQLDALRRTLAWFDRYLGAGTRRPRR